MSHWITNGWDESENVYGVTYPASSLKGQFPRVRTKTEREAEADKRSSSFDILRSGTLTGSWASA